MAQSLEHSAATVDKVSPQETALEPKASAVFHRSLNKPFPKILTADGIYFYLENGQKILDATGGPAVACLGHNNPTVNAAMIAQINRAAYCHSLFFSTDATEQLCSNLIRGTGGEMSKAFIASSGSEAIEAAIKMARQYFVELEGPDTKRQNFISRQNSYHGNTLGALSLGGHPARRKTYAPLLGINTTYVSPCYEYRGLRDDESQKAYVNRLTQELDDEFQRLGPKTVCAFVAETVSGSGLGCVTPVPFYFAAMRKVCDKYGALLILDEIMCGMGRCGYLHAWQLPEVDVIPDIQTVAKGLGGGYAPISAMLVGKRVVEVISQGSGSFNHGHTYQAHPVACAAALAVQKFIEDEGLVDRVRSLGYVLGTSLKKRLSDRWYVGDIRGVGLFWAVELVKNKKTKEPFDPSQEIGARINELAMSTPYSLFVYPGGGHLDGSSGDHMLLAPPFICSDEEICFIVTTLGRVLDDFFFFSE